MEFLQSVGEAILDALIILWDMIIGYLPNLIAAIVILIIGIIIARLIAMLIEKIIKAIKLDELIRKIDIVQKFEGAGNKVIFSKIIAWLVKWFLYIVLLIAVSEILNLEQFTLFLKEIAMYLPNVIVAVLILVVGIVLGDFVDRLIISVLKGTKAKKGPLVGAIAKWAIFIFAILAALIQLGVAVTLIQTLFTAIIAAIALACGLAFGLGGKDAAKDFVETMREDIKK